MPQICWMKKQGRSSLLPENAVLAPLASPSSAHQFSPPLFPVPSISCFFFTASSLLSKEYSCFTPMLRVVLCLEVSSQPTHHLQKPQSMFLLPPSGERLLSKSPFS
ncbi:Hypothetical predicted protein [Podarcis lilfordi]|uniref:Uncharacterized protein n=1 Tax=Podarcis lilfordi TaxID=74358 RepID=A0AA35PC62_9SAUR|nr:Hypothetical predicted protein [Podarcis lilfordi]